LIVTVLADSFQFTVAPSDCAMKRRGTSVRAPITKSALFYPRLLAPKRLRACWC
jgi:hypothetical protein